MLHRLCLPAPGICHPSGRWQTRVDPGAFFMISIWAPLLTSDPSPRYLICMHMGRCLHLIGGADSHRFPSFECQIKDLKKLIVKSRGIQTFFLFLPCQKFGTALGARRGGAEGSHHWKRHKNLFLHLCTASQLPSGRGQLTRAQAKLKALAGSNWAYQP